MIVGIMHDDSSPCPYLGAIKVWETEEKSAGNEKKVLFPVLFVRPDCIISVKRLKEKLQKQ